MKEPIRIKEKYKVVPSKEPDGKLTYIVVYESETTQGCNYQRVFKGNYRECLNKKDELERRKRDVRKSKGISSRIFRRKSYN